MTNGERRYAPRKMLDLQVITQSGNGDFSCHTRDVSPTGIKLHRNKGQQPATPVCNLEIHLVNNAITTVIPSKSVWRNDEYEAFEFVSPSFSQQMILERLSGNL